MGLCAVAHAWRPRPGGYKCGAASGNTMAMYALHRMCSRRVRGSVTYHMILSLPCNLPQRFPRLARIFLIKGIPSPALLQSLPSTPTQSLSGQLSPHPCQGACRSSACSLSRSRRAQQWCMRRFRSESQHWLRGEQLRERGSVNWQVQG